MLLKVLFDQLDNTAIDQLKIYKVNEDQDFPPAYYERQRVDTWMGTPVLSSLEIKGGSYKDLNGGQIDFEGIFLDTVLFNVSRQKRITQTTVNGSNSTVKELWASGDYSVEIATIITSPQPNVFPTEAASRMIRILDAPLSLEVVSPFLQLYGIYNLAVTGQQHRQRPGFNNSQGIQFSGLSDQPLELTLAKGLR